MKTPIFLIEDNNMYSMMLSLKLNDMFSVITHEFESAEEAIDNLHLKPSIVIMDYMLGGMDGVEATKIIKQKYPKIQVIAVSSQINMQLVDEFMNAGASLFIHKEKDSPRRLIEAIAQLAN